MTGLDRYLSARSWWIENQPRINAFKWGFALGATLTGLLAIIVTS